jgi:hypothetical protein
MIENLTGKPVEFMGKVYDTRHGGPFDRGSADSYYGRSRRPHFFTEATYRSDEIEERFMTQAQIAEYHAGYDYNEQGGWKKEW